MAKSDTIPEPTVRRLSLYLRQLELYQQSGLRTVSSKQLAEPLQLHPDQIRKDFAFLGQFGQPGIGYQIDELVLAIRRTLGTDRTWNVALVGAGNLGKALLSYRGFEQKGFFIVAAFDTADSKIGSTIAGRENLFIQPMAELESTVRAKNVELAILTVPASVAEAVAQQLYRYGIKGILNFAPVLLPIAPALYVESVDVAVHLEQLSFRVAGFRK